MIREGKAIFDELDRLSPQVAAAEAFIELLADNPGPGGRGPASGYDRLEAMGEKAVLATTAAMLAGALYVDGRYGEADRYCTVSETTAAPEDLITQVLWRGVRAQASRPGRTGRTRARRWLAKQCSS